MTRGHAAGRPVKSPGSRGGVLRELRKNKWAYLLVLPALIYILIYCYLTLPYLTIAFQRYNYRQGMLGSAFIGLENFRFFFRSTDAWVVTFNTLRLNLLFIIGTTLVSLLMALLLNELSRFQRMKRIAQSTMIMPYFVSWMIISYILYAILASEVGLLNSILKALGMQGKNWYNEKSIWVTTLVIVKVWKELGMTTVIYLATITGIDGALYEAATIDGAGRLRQAQHITLPLLMPTVTVLTLLSVGRIFYGDFGMIYSIVGDNGVLFSVTDVIDTYTFRLLRYNGDPAAAMAIGLFQSVVGFLMVMGSNLLVKRKFPEGAIF